ncbi:MAG: hypothetical protein IJ735_00625 [Clostridia bacterium]|nr:hypothetical protein [Clostridia bacterium]
MPVYHVHIVDIAERNMIQDTVNEILQAEAEAERITAEANEEAKRVVTVAEENATKLRAETVKSVKEERKKVAESAEKEGDAQYEKILLAGKAKADDLREHTDVNKAAEFIKNKVLEGYVRR